MARYQLCIIIIIIIIITKPESHFSNTLVLDGGQVNIQNSSSSSSLFNDESAPSGLFIVR